MPFPSSEEGLESLLVIQPHLSWQGGPKGGVVELGGLVELGEGSSTRNQF